MNNRERIQKVYEMLNQGQPLEAFDAYYDENVVMIEGTGERFEGKAENRKREEGFFGSVANIHGGGVNGMTSDEEAGVTMVESWMDVEFQDGKRVKMEQVARQQWQNGKIVEERFYYNPQSFEG